jgi:SHS family sialic acid transporter-like MFS transporter
MALAAALLGWMFDGLEQGLFPLVARPALRELLHTTEDSQVALWFSVATAGFLVGAATGGVLFGWLGDRIGRVRAMMLTVLTYAVFSGLCCLATAAWQIAVLRFCSALGMGGEWSLGVALVMEIWPEKSRAVLAGLIGAAANVGFLLIALGGLGLTTMLQQTQGWLLALGLSEASVQRLVAHNGWRLLMLFGAAPAFLTLLIRLFVPESERWQQEQKRGATSGWATRDLLGVAIGAAGAGLIIYVWAANYPDSFRAFPLLCVWAANYPWSLRLTATAAGLMMATAGYTYPVVRYLQRSNLSGVGPAHALRPTMSRMLLAACLGGVALTSTWGANLWIPLWADRLAGSTVAEASSFALIASALGAIAGTLVGAMLGKWLGRRLIYALLCFSSLGSAMLLYQGNSSYGPWFLASVFLVGCTTASFYGWLPLYLPELFRTSVRATGQGFSYNFGRILAAIGVLQTGNLMKDVFENNYPKALSVISLVYIVGIVLIWLAPETHGKPLPE